MLQTVARAYLARRFVKEKQEKQKNLLRFSVSEILTTERKYVESLDLLITNFKRPMENSPDLVSPQEVEMIFSNIEELRDTNGTFLKALDQAFLSSDFVQIAKSVSNFFMCVLDVAGSRGSEFGRLCVLLVRLRLIGDGILCSVTTIGSR